MDRESHITNGEDVANKVMKRGYYCSVNHDMSKKKSHQDFSH